MGPEPVEAIKQQAIYAIDLLKKKPLCAIALLSQGKSEEHRHDQDSSSCLFGGSL